MKTVWNKTPKKKKVKEKKKLNVRTIERKYLETWVLFLYEERYYEKKLIEQCDSLRSAIIRHRTTCGGVARCDSYHSCKGCKETVTYHTAHASHCIDRGWYSHRWDLRNWGACCPICNNPTFNAMDHKMMLMEKIDRDYGVGTFQEMRQVRNKIKPSIDELLVIRAYLQAILDKVPEEWR